MWFLFSLQVEYGGYRKYSLPNTPSASRAIGAVPTYRSATSTYYSYMWHRDSRTVAGPSDAISISNMSEAYNTSGFISGVRQIQPMAQRNTQCYAANADLQSQWSANEILDNYLQLGSDIYNNFVPITNSRAVDWTHFGGDPPPDEIDILRGQNQLLHYQLLFERHMREVHAQRNRRLLGKCKAAKDLEEQYSAMVMF